MERLVLRTVYNNVLGVMILPVDGVTNTVSGRTDFVAFEQKIRNFARLSIFWLILHNVFGEGSNSANLSERIADLIMISEEHWKNDELLFQSVNEQRGSVNLRIRAMHITYCLCDVLFMGTVYITYCLCDFLFMGTLA